MNLIPRKEEIEEIAAIVDANHPSAEECAKKVIKAVAELLWFRDWYVIALADGSGFGPFASQAEAFAIATKYHGILVPGSDKGWGVLYVHGMGGAAEERKGGGFGYCVTPGCGHPAYTHSMVGHSRGKCVLSTCNCGQYLAALKKPVKPRTTTRKKATS